MYHVTKRSLTSRVGGDKGASFLAPCPILNPHHLPVWRADLQGTVWEKGYLNYYIILWL